MMYPLSSYYSSRFKRFVEAALYNEGLFADDPDDVGGKTIFGIASKYWKRDYKQCMAYYKAGDTAQAIEYAVSFYHKNFYSLYYDQIVDESLAFKLFDFGINASPERAVKALQTVLCKKFLFRLVIDGALGARTVKAINFATNLEKSKLIEDESLLYEAFIYELKEFYEDRKTFWKFGRGWFHRLRKVYNESRVNGKVKWAYVKTRAF